MKTSKLETIILFFIQYTEKKMSKVVLAKHIYYTDGSWFQENKTTISDSSYIHIEDNPQPLYFDIALHNLITSKQIVIKPNLKLKNTDSGNAIHIQSFYFESNVSVNTSLFSKKEMQHMNQVLNQLNGDITFENKYYSKLYQLYVQTNLYETIHLNLIDIK